MALAETAKLAIDLSLTGNAAAGLKGVEQRLSSLNTRAGKLSGGFKTLGAGLGVAVVNGAKLAAVAIGGLSALIIKSVREGQDAAKVQTIYANAIANSGKVSTQYVKILNDQQTALMNLAGVDDELIKTEQTRLIQMGLTGEQVAKLTPLILDFSKATGTDLLTATKLVGKSVNGNVGALARYGVSIDKAKAKTDPFAATVDALNGKFGGTTKALSGSLDARLGAFRENMANIREELGIRLLPALTRIVDVAGKDLVPAFGKFIDRIMPSLISGLDTFASMLENGGAERGIRAITDALGPMVELLKIASAPIKAIVSAFLSLPPQVQGVLVAGFAVNKLSGGLIAKGVGEIAGGLLQRGGTPANPLFVLDVTGGGVGGIPGAAKGGLGLISKVFLVGEAIGLAVLVNDVRQSIADGNTKTSEAIKTQTTEWLAKQPSRADLLTGLAGVEQGIKDINSSNLPLFLVQGEALDNLKAMRADIQAQLQHLAGWDNVLKSQPGWDDVRKPQSANVAVDARSAGMRGIVERAARAGFRPTQAAVTATYERNVKRAAEAQQRAADKTKLAGDRLISAALILTRAGERLSNVRIPTFSPPRPAGAPPIYANPTGPGHHMAGGGPVWRDHDYLVGEEGPEVFRPKRDGTIIPHGLMPHGRIGENEQDAGDSEAAWFIRLAQMRAKARLRRLRDTSHPLPALSASWRNAAGLVEGVSGNVGSPFVPSARLDASQIIDRRRTARLTEDRGAYLTVKAVATTRDISTASTVKGRMGPTISQAGGI